MITMPPLSDDELLELIDYFNHPHQASDPLMGKTRIALLHYREIRDGWRKVAEVIDGVEWSWEW